jgi:hypothetical protein
LLVFERGVGGGKWGGLGSPTRFLGCCIALTVVGEIGKQV